MILMGSRTQKRLANLLVCQIENENRIERCRLALCRSPEVDFFRVFQIIDQPKRGFFQNDEMLDFLYKHQIQASTREIQNLINQLDADSDGIVSYENFLDFVLPKQNEDLRREVLVRERVQATRIDTSDSKGMHQNSSIGSKQQGRRPQNVSNSFDGLNASKRQESSGFDAETETLLATLFSQMILNYKNIEAKKSVLHSSTDFQLEVAFKTLDSSNIDKLDYEALEEFLVLHGLSVAEKDLLVLIRRFGSLQDGFINQAQFMDMVLPSEFNLKKQAVQQSFQKSNKINQTIQSTKRTADSALTEPKRSVGFASDKGGSDSQSQTNTSQLNQTLKFGKSQARIQTQARIGSQKSIVLHNESMKPDGRSTFKNQSQTLNQNEIELQNSFKKSLSRGGLKTPFSKRLGSGYGINGSSLTGIVSGNSLEHIEGDAEEYEEERAFGTRGSAMKGDEEQFFVRKMYELLRSDAEVENLKQELASQRDFNLLDSFHCLDMQGKGYLTQKDLFMNLRSLGINPSKDSIYLFFKQYDLDFSGRLEYSEFVKTFIPIEQSYRNILNNKESTGNGFTSETKQLLKETFQSILKNTVQVELIRQQLNRRVLFNSFDAFSAIDQDGNGAITLEDIRTLFFDYDIHFAPKEIYYFFRRFDKGLDGDVCYGEFFSEITPKSPYAIQESSMNTSQLIGKPLDKMKSSQLSSKVY